MACDNGDCKHDGWKMKDPLPYHDR